jgi:hypothetical protein
LKLKNEIRYLCLFFTVLFQGEPGKIGQPGLGGKPGQPGGVGEPGPIGRPGGFGKDGKLLLLEITRGKRYNLLIQEP